MRCAMGGFSPQELRERVLRGKYRIPFYMSTDCENLLKKFLILNPTKRGTLEVREGGWETHGSTPSGVLGTPSVVLGTFSMILDTRGIL